VMVRITLTEGHIYLADRHLSLIMRWDKRIGCKRLSMSMNLNDELYSNGKL